MLLEKHRPTALARRLPLPWRSRRGDFSPLKAAALVLVLLPGLSMLSNWAGGAYGPMPVHGLLYWSGVWATALLLLALAVTPASRILDWRGLIAIRRMIGVAALAYTIFHVLTYFALDNWDLGQVAREMMALSPNILAATLSTLGLIVLGATSFDAAIARMGAKAWRTLHRLVHLLALLAVIHFLLSRGIFPVQYLFAGMLFWLVAWRGLDRLERGTDSIALLALALASFLLTAFLEALWMWFHHGVRPGGTFAANFDLDSGLSSAWQILALGLLAALAPRARQSLISRMAPRGPL